MSILPAVLVGILSATLSTAVRLRAFELVKAARALHTQYTDTYIDVIAHCGRRSEEADLQSLRLGIRI